MGFLPVLNRLNHWCTVDGWWSCVGAGWCHIPGCSRCGLRRSEQGHGVEQSGVISQVSARAGAAGEGVTRAVPQARAPRAGSGLTLRFPADCRPPGWRGSMHTAWYGRPGRARSTALGAPAWRKAAKTRPAGPCSLHGDGRGRWASWCAAGSAGFCRSASSAARARRRRHAGRRGRRRAAGRLPAAPAPVPASAEIPAATPDRP